MIPLSAGSRVIGGSTGARRAAGSWRAYVDRTIAETRSQLDSFDPDHVMPEWRPHLRVNFTLVEEGLDDGNG
jgi:hypothetical protein